MKKQLKQFKKKRRQLISSFLNGKVDNFVEAYSDLVDDYFRNVFEAKHAEIRTKNPYAIVAVGGYGRKEMCIGSDIDLVFLFKDKIDEKIEQVIEHIVYPLWDLKLDVAYSTHTIKDYLDLIKENYMEFTSALDARFVCGQSSIFFEFMHEIRDSLIAKSKEQIIKMLIKKGEERHKKYGDSSYLLEPHIKGGKGGLRDYHTMLWIAKLDYLITSAKDLEIYGYIPHKGYDILSKILSFLWKVRNSLHYICQRRNDRLYLEYQRRVAKIIGIRRENGKRVAEVFLNKLHSHMDMLKDMYVSFLIEHAYKGKHRRSEDKQLYTESIEVRNGLLYFRSSEDIIRNPALLIKIFEESQRLGIPLSAEAKAIVKDFLFLVDKNFRSSPAILKSFEKILISPVKEFDVMEDMLHSGFLERFLPPFKGIINRIQYDEYHIYPVDKHCLCTVQKIKEFEKSQDSIYAKIYKEIKHKKQLLWAGLLHDIGKQSPRADHSKKGALIAEKLLKELGYEDRFIEEVKFLIENHLFLVKIATRRDINDEETALYCAKKIEDIERLKKLYLLSVADSMSTGAAIWNDWTETLLKNLFLKVLNVMEKGEIASKASLKIIEQKRKWLASQLKEDQKELIPFMSPRYMLYVSEQDIKKHVELYSKLNNKTFVWAIEKNSAPDIRIITVCAHDQPGLFSKIAGILTLNQIDILEAQVYTWRNNIAMDIIKVRPPLDRLLEEERWHKVEQELKDALEGRLDIEKAINKKSSIYRPRIRAFSKKTKKVIIDNKSSSFFTIIEVHAPDFMGLLYKITNAIFKCGLNIWVAKVATKVDQVVDIFYVRDFDGQKVNDPEYLEKIKKEIKKAIKEERYEKSRSYYKAL
ncbi:MAG: [protein-PII] uridylyltransferase [Deltaproteobacteria bacterium]|nr:MAG: [protein-PII] uridylyltransferase [Deltaproteobacteria bacterium]